MDAIVVMKMSPEERLDLLIKLITAHTQLQEQFDQVVEENIKLTWENYELKKAKGV